MFDELGKSGSTLCVWEETMRIAVSGMEVSVGFSMTLLIKHDWCSGLKPCTFTSYCSVGRKFTMGHTGLKAKVREGRGSRRSLLIAWSASIP
jgi:hypothetical protein